MFYFTDVTQRSKGQHENKEEKQVQSSNESQFLTIESITHFEHNMNFASISKVVTLAHFLMSAIMYSFI